MKIEVGKKYKDNCNRTWKILYKIEEEHIHSFNFLGTDTNTGYRRFFHENGLMLDFTGEFLVSEVKELKKFKSLVRVCIYKGTESGACWDCNSRDCTDKIKINCKDNVIGTKVVEIEVTEGEGMKDEN